VQSALRKSLHVLRIRENDVLVRFPLQSPRIGVSASIFNSFRFPCQTLPKGNKEHSQEKGSGTKWTTDGGKTAITIYE
jgi:hypothetical protein